MAEPTNKELAYQLIGFLESLGAQWAEIKTAVLSGRSPTHASSAMDAFGEQLAAIEKVVREAAARLDEDVPEEVRLCRECKNPMVHFEAILAANQPEGWVCTHASCDYWEPEPQAEASA